MILVIDDLREFSPPKADVVYAKTSSEGLRALQTQAFEEVWLDYDLGGADTILPVVNHLLEKAVWGEGYNFKIVVHSANVTSISQAVALSRYYRVRRTQATLENLVAPNP